MVYVRVEGEHEVGRAGSNGWHDTADVIEAITAEFRRWEFMWAEMGHGPCRTYRVVVTDENSPYRTAGGLPLPAPEQVTTAA